MAHFEPKCPRERRVKEQLQNNTHAKLNSEKAHSVSLGKMANTTKDARDKSENLLRVLVFGLGRKTEKDALRPQTVNVRFLTFFAKSATNGSSR